MYEELKVKMSSFKPIDDNTPESTLKKVDYITITIIYMIYAIQLKLQEVELKRIIAYIYTNTGNAWVLENRPEHKTVVQNEGKIFPWKGTGTASPKRKLIAAFSLSAGRARQCRDHRDKFSV